MIDLNSICAEVLARSQTVYRRFSILEMSRPGRGFQLLNVLLFLDGQATPSVFVKITSDPDHAQVLEAELRTMGQLHDTGDAVLRSGLPRPLLFERIGEAFVMAESAAPGIRIKNLRPGGYYGSPAFDRDLGRVTEWLVALHRTQPPTGSWPAPADLDPRGAIDEYRREFLVSDELNRLLDTTTEALSDSSIRRGPWHGDFCTANVLASTRDIQVIDWEHPLESNWPVGELIHYLTSIWCVPYRKGPEAIFDNYRRMFFEPHPSKIGIRRSIDGYLDALDIGREALLPLAALCWVIQANRKLRLITPSDPAPRPLIVFRDSRCLNLELLAERAAEFLPG